MLLASELIGEEGPSSLCHRVESLENTWKLETDFFFIQGEVEPKPKTYKKLGLLEATKGIIGVLELCSA